MLKNWLSPVPLDDILVDLPLSSYQIGKNIAIYSSNRLPGLKTAKIAIVGINPEESNLVRRFLYSMGFHFGKLRIADIGNVRKPTMEFVVPVLQELISGGIIPIIIGNDQAFTYAQYQAYRIQDQLINMVLLNAHIPYTTDNRYKKDNSYFLNKIFEDPNRVLFHTGIVGYQSHYSNPKVISYLDDLYVEHIRLGMVKANLSEIEPVVRDADLFGLDISALKQSEAPGQKNASPSGLFSEETCRICRYVAMSDKLTSIGIYGYNKDYDINNQTAKLVAQLIWYCFDGIYHRKNDYPITTNGFVQYVVGFKNGDYELTFWKSTRSDRWWMQVPEITHEKQERHRLVPCSYNDYLLACREELPERLLHAYKRFL